MSQSEFLSRATISHAARMNMGHRSRRGSVHMQILPIKSAILNLIHYSYKQWQRSVLFTFSCPLTGIRVQEAWKCFTNDRPGWACSTTTLWKGQHGLTWAFESRWRFFLTVLNYTREIGCIPPHVQNKHTCEIVSSWLVDETIIGLMPLLP